ncbi:Rrf2 family transcriptional regulator [Thioalkalivibrio paradoxus]|uniref:Transcriptional regulator n=1 Tax=Thioalkalivibrio paradoxus ARh 1 TaxID=713585 RepID=W0DPP9_9GAMM|nr:Rrf2 family transcriptional regulator [Thioalkalivibrio paradoxus]AHE98840.1 transcriptional regulator [Thioalkalivibrio paradoxus ARh 1]
MKLTTKGRYAVTAMLDVAMHAQQRPVSLADVARRQHLSLSYLEQLFARLRRKGLVSSSRGPGGGYRLSHPPEAITVADIIVAVDEPVDVTRCGGEANCTHRSQCLTHDLWTDLSRQVERFLSERSLADVLHRHRAARAARAGLPESSAGRDTIPIAAAADSESR